MDSPSIDDIDWAQGKENVSIACCVLKLPSGELMDKSKVLNYNKDYAKLKILDVSDQRVSCDCNDGCLSDHCECKIASKKLFEEKNPNVSWNNVFKHGRLNVDGYFNFVREHKIEVFECCHNCKCQQSKRIKCDNSLTSKFRADNSTMNHSSINHPLLVMSTTHLSSMPSPSNLPRMFSIYTIEKGSFIGLWFISIFIAV